MARNLDKLSKDELYLFLAEKVGLEAATAIRNEGVSGDTLVELTDNELRTLLPKLGLRRMVRNLVDDFQGGCLSEPKVSSVAKQAVLTCTVCTNHYGHNTVQVAICTHWNLYIGFRVFVCLFMLNTKTTT